MWQNLLGSALTKTNQQTEDKAYEGDDDNRGKRNGDKHDSLQITQSCLLGKPQKVFGQP